MPTAASTLGTAMLLAAAAVAGPGGCELAVDGGRRVALAGVSAPALRVRQVGPGNVTTAAVWQISLCDKAPPAALSLGSACGTGDGFAFQFGDVAASACRRRFAVAESDWAWDGAAATRTLASSAAPLSAPMRVVLRVTCGAASPLAVAGPATAVGASCGAGNGAGCTVIIPLVSPVLCRRDEHGTGGSWPQVLRILGIALGATVVVVAVIAVAFAALLKKRERERREAEENLGVGIDQSPLIH